MQLVDFMLYKKKIKSNSDVAKMTTRMIKFNISDHFHKNEQRNNSNAVDISYNLLDITSRFYIVKKSLIRL